MTPQKVMYACSKYALILEARCGARPIRDPDAKSGPERLNHVRWMCDEIPNFLKTDQPFETETSISKREKAMRWLGFVQGVISAYDVLTVEEMKEDNR